MIWAWVVAAFVGAVPPPIVDHVEVSGQPVQVKRISLTDSGDLEVLIRNESTRSVRFVAFTLAPADCPARVKPLALWMAYGDWSAVDEDAAGPFQAALDPGAVVTLSLSEAEYRRMIEGQIARGCSTDARPELVLGYVAFCDGSGWEGFADGADHSVWNGRPWTPNGVPRNCDLGGTRGRVP